METGLIGYVATSASVIGFTAQFIHTVKTRKIEGVSLHRTCLDFLSLALGVLYATRVEDTPLLIATSVELCLSFSIFVSFVYFQKGQIVFRRIVPSPSPTLTASSDESSPVSTTEV